MMQLTLLTLVVAVGVAMLLFKVYHIGLVAVLNHFQWDMDELKTYPKTAAVKAWDHLAQALIGLLVIWKVFYT
jgi:Ni,Fe-hydrogenase I cytochrome b subunit